MKFSFAATAIYCAGLVLAQAPGFTINTPSNPVQCQPLLISWSGGTGPYFLSVHNGDDPSSAALLDLGQQPAGATSFSWTQVTFQANTRIGFSLRDSSGATAQSAAVTVQSSSDNSCLNGGTPNTSSSASGSGSDTAAPPASTSGPAATTTPASTPGATTTAPSSPAATTSAPRTSSAPTSRASTGTNAPASTSSGNTAPTNAVHLGAAGLVGAAIVAILA